MPNDAKFGLIVGVAVVIAISVVFFRKEPVPSAARGREAAAAAVGANSVPAAPTHSLSRPIKLETAEEGRITGQRHPDPFTPPSSAEGGGNGGGRR